MKRMLLVILIMVTLLASMIGPAWAIFTPSGKTPYTQADITEASRIINGLKWDLSQTSKGIVKLTVPKTLTKYGININRYSLLENGVSADDGGNVYLGVGGTTLTLTISVKLRTGFSITVFSYETGRVLAEEQYIYTPGKEVKYILPQDRRYPTFNGEELTGWSDGLGNQFNPDGTPVQKPEIKPVVLPFNDIDNHWAVKDIVSLKDAGFINGYPDGSFKPENTITRAEFMVMLGRIMGVKYTDAKTYTYESLFVDDSSHWSYKEAVKSFGYLQSNEITHIFQDDYIPDQPITREEVVAVLNAILKNNKGFQFTPNGYLVLKDTNSSRFPESIVFSLKYDLVKGYPDSTFRPTGNITRAEISAVLVRMLGKL